MERTLESLEATIDQLASRNEDIEADKATLIAENDTLRQEAIGHAQEARTQRTTVHEIYQIVSGGRGEPGDWNGAEPVRKAFESLRDENAELRRQLVSMRAA